MKQQRERRIKRDYGLTLVQHKQMYIDQNGCCAICKIPIAYNKVQTDHDHATGKVRGLLCTRCNSFLAAIDDKEFLEPALEYLEK